MAQSKSRKLVTGTISAAVIASALAPVAASASTAKITTVYNPSTKTVYQGQTVSLPSTVTVKYSNGKKASAKVSWGKVSTSVGTHKITGHVAGTTKTASITVVVKADSVKSVSTVSSVTVKAGLVPTSPKATVIYYSGKKTTATVNLSKVDTSKVGTQTVKAMVSGKTVYVDVKVTAPGVTSATPLNAKQIKVVFDNGKTVTITLPYSFKDGSTTSSFSYYGNYYKSVSLTTPYVAAPAVSSVSAINLDEVQVTFTKAVDPNSIVDGAFNIGGSINASAVTLSSDGKTATIALTSALTNNTYNEVKVTGLQTTNGDVIPDYDQIVKLSDTTLPTVSSVNYVKAANTATVNFSEPLSSVGTMTLTDANGVTTTVDTSGFSVGDSNFAIPTTTLADGTYTVKIEGARDLAGNYFASNKYQTTFTVGSNDTTAPTVTSIKPLSGNLVQVTFSEKLYNAGSIALNGAPMPTALKLDSTGKLANAGDYTVDSTGTVYTINVGSSLTNNAYNTLAFTGQVDNAGNTIAVPTTKTFSYLDNAAPVLKSTSVVGSKVYLTYDENVTIANGTTAQFVSPDGIHQTVAAANIANGTTDNVVVVDLSSYVPSVQTGSYSLSFAKGALSDVNTNTAAYSTTFNLTSAADTTKPTVATTSGFTYDPTAGTVTIKYSEPMGSSATNVNNYTVDGQNVFSDAYFSGDKTTVVLTLKSGAFDTDATRQFKIANVSDVAGNVIDTYTNDQPFKDNTAPTVQSAALAADGSSIALTFSEPLDAATLDDSLETAASAQNQDFDVYVGGSKYAGTVTEAATTTGDKIHFTLSFGPALTPAQVASGVVVKPSSTINVTDVDGNALNFSSITAK